MAQLCNRRRDERDEKKTMDQRQREIKAKQELSKTGQVRRTRFTFKREERQTKKNEQSTTKNEEERRERRKQ